MEEVTKLQLKNYKIYKDLWENVHNYYYVPLMEAYSELTEGKIDPNSIFPTTKEEFITNLKKALKGDD